MTYCVKCGHYTTVSTVTCMCDQCLMQWLKDHSPRRWWEPDIRQEIENLDL